MAGEKHRQTNTISDQVVPNVTRPTLHGFAYDSIAQDIRSLHRRSEVIRDCTITGRSGIASASTLTKFTSAAWRRYERCPSGSTTARLSPLHLQRYVNEFAGQHNHGPVPNASGRVWIGRHALTFLLDSRQSLRPSHCRFGRSWVKVWPRLLVCTMWPVVMAEPLRPCSNDETSRRRANTGGPDLGMSDQFPYVTASGSATSRRTRRRSGNRPTATVFAIAALRNLLRLPSMLDSQHRRPRLRPLRRLSPAAHMPQRYYDGTKVSTPIPHPYDDVSVVVLEPSQLVAEALERRQRDRPLPRGHPAAAAKVDAEHAVVARHQDRRGVPDGRWVLRHVLERAGDLPHDPRVRLQLLLNLERRGPVIHGPNRRRLTTGA